MPKVFQTVLTIISVEKPWLVAKFQKEAPSSCYLVAPKQGSWLSAVARWSTYENLKKPLQNSFKKKYFWGENWLLQDVNLFHFVLFCFVLWYDEGHGWLKKAKEGRSTKLVWRKWNLAAHYPRYALCTPTSHCCITPPTHSFKPCPSIGIWKQ